MTTRRHDMRAREERINLGLWVAGVLMGVLFGVAGTILIGLTSGVIS